MVWSGTDPGGWLLKGNLASKGAGKGPSCLSLSLDKDDGKHAKSSKINAFGR